jgi:glycosyltransferase involved in cell wall biosynthesis
MTGAPRIAAVTPGPPRSPDTLSGVSVALLDALERAGAEVGAVDAWPPLLELAEKAASVSPDAERWKQRYNAGASPLSGLIRRARGRVASRRLASSMPEAEVVLQMTGYFDPEPPGQSALRASYHDDNLAGFVRRRDLKLDRESPWLTRAFAYERGLYDRIDLIFSMSELVGRSFIDDFGQSPDKVVVAGAGPNIPVPARAPARGADPPRFLFVGKRFERKGGPTVLEAFRRLRAEREDAELEIVGPSDLRLDLPGVTVHGRVARSDAGADRRLTALYERATAFVMPSVYEPLGVAIVEAMAWGLPCVAATAGAMPELVADGETGFLVEPGDVDALTARMRALAQDPELGRRLGDAGHRRYLERFTWDAVAERMLAAIAERGERSGPR